MIKETYYNEYLDKWGTGTKPIDEVIFIMRSYKHVLSPSWKLLKDWNTRDKTKLTWPEYIRRFLVEMETAAAQSEIQRLADVSRSRDIWLVCSCYNSRGECHRYLILDLIRKSGGLVAGGE